VSARPSRASPEQLARLAPLAGLSAERLAQLAEAAVLERAARASDPVREHAHGGQLLFLLQGELLLAFKGGGTQVIVGGSEDSAQPLNRQPQPLARTKAITDVDIVAIDDELLDVLATWDQAVRSHARFTSGAFSLNSLRSGAFAQLPSAHVNELLQRFERLRVERGATVVREGDEGDFYYVVESGRFEVARLVGGAHMGLAELKPGDAFGEEALVSGAKRNASVTALSDGEVLRVGRGAFNDLLREPLLRRMSFREASDKVRSGAQWIDVRYPSEYQHDKLPGALNVPLGEVRDMFEILDRGREYVVYCLSGRRSAAAAFLFAQRGFRVWLLEGGLKAAGENRS
jgi:rhodanese-related sulfurtransferase